MRFRNRLGNGKPEPVVIALAVAYLVETIEPFKQTGLLFRRYFLPKIFYRKQSMPSLFVKGKTDLVASVSIFYIKSQS